MPSLQYWRIHNRDTQISIETLFSKDRLNNMKKIVFFDLHGRSGLSEPQVLNVAFHSSFVFSLKGTPDILHRDAGVQPWESRDPSGQLCGAQCQAPQGLTASIPPQADRCLSWAVYSWRFTFLALLSKAAALVLSVLKSMCVLKSFNLINHIQEGSVMNTVNG